MAVALRVRCLVALAKAAEEVSPSWLGGLAVERRPSSLSPGEHGALVSMAVDDQPMHVGLFMAPGVGQTLTKFFVGLQPADEDLPTVDVADALCEVANVLAGVMKRRLGDGMRIDLGLPLFYSGGYPKHPGVDASSQPLGIGGLAVTLVVIG